MEGSMSQLATKNEGAVARPLGVLIPLIKEDFEHAEQAGMEFYEAAGAKLIEARDGHFEGDSAGFFTWAEQKFGKKQSQTRLYMTYAAAKNPKSFVSLKDFTRKTYS